MSSIFISYSRHSETVAKLLADHIAALGHSVWLDKELKGGQIWWDQILAKVRNCDVFAFVLDPQGLSSTACMREYGYAIKLGKPILPVLAAEGVSTNLLPPALSQVQFVDYRTQDRDAVLRLSRAIVNIPPPKPLPDPLPPPPEVPISYLGHLAEQIESPSTLNYEQQSVLLVDLRRGLREPENAADARVLLKKLRKRRDLLATIADEIDELLGRSRRASAVSPSPSLKPEPVPQPVKAEPPLPERIVTPAIQPAPAEVAPLGLIKAKPAPTRRERWVGAVTWFVLGTIVGFAAMATTPHDPQALGFFTGAGGAIAGAIAGKRPRRIVGMLIGAAAGWFIVATMVGGRDALPAGAVLGASPGFVLGALVGRLFDRRKA